MPRQNIASGAPWEERIGYSRAVRVGNIVHVGGTAAVDEQGAIVGVGDVEAQTAFILTKIEMALQRAGASLRDVVRTRIFVVNIEEWEHIGTAHNRVFGTIRPVTTMVQVSRLIDPRMLVEIEVEAILESPAEHGGQG